MNNLVCAAEFGVLVLKNIEAVRADGDDFFYAVGVQRLNVLIRHHLEKKLVTGSAGRVAGAHFFLSKNGVFDTNVGQNCCERLRYFLCPLVKTAGATNPKKNLRRFAISGHFGHGRNVHDDEFKERQK